MSSRGQGRKDIQLSMGSSARLHSLIPDTTTEEMCLHQQTIRDILTNELFTKFNRLPE